jgi:hypothetical protein
MSRGRDVPPATANAPTSTEAKVLPEVNSIVTKTKKCKRTDKLKKGGEDRQRPESEEEQEAPYLDTELYMNFEFPGIQRSISAYIA